MMREGDQDLAIADLTQAIGLDPDLVSAYALRGELYLARRDFDRAIVDLEATLRLDPNHPGVEDRLVLARMLRDIN